MRDVAVSTATKRIIASPSRRKRRLAMSDHYYPIHELIESQAKPHPIAAASGRRPCIV